MESAIKILSKYEFLGVPVFGDRDEIDRASREMIAAPSSSAVLDEMSGTTIRDVTKLAHDFLTDAVIREHYDSLLTEYFREFEAADEAGRQEVNDLYFEEFDTLDVAYAATRTQRAGSIWSRNFNTFLFAIMACAASFTIVDSHSPILLKLSPIICTAVLAVFIVRSAYFAAFPYDRIRRRFQPKTMWSDNAGSPQRRSAVKKASIMAGILVGTLVTTMILALFALHS